MSQNTINTNRRTQNNQQQTNRRNNFRFQKDSIHLTYETHLNHEAIIEFLRNKGRGFKWFSVVCETSEDNHYEHTHFACQWTKRIDTNNPRFFDFNGIHPNIQQITGKSHAIRIYDDYHKKDGIPTQSVESPQTSQTVIEQIREAPSLAEAIDIAGIEIRSVSDIVLIRNDVERRGPFEHNFPNTNWLLFKQFTRVLFCHGPTGTGKTQWAVHQFTNPLLVSHIDSLRNFTSANDGIVFDDMSFAHLPRESVIHLLDWDEDREIHCRYRCAIIPKHTRKIFTSNLSLEQVFPHDDSGAIRRRITETIFVHGPTFSALPVALEEIQDVQQIRSPSHPLGLGLGSIPARVDSRSMPVFGYPSDVVASSSTTDGCISNSFNWEEFNSGQIEFGQRERGSFGQDIDPFHYSNESVPSTYTCSTSELNVLLNDAINHLGPNDMLISDI